MRSQKKIPTILGLLFVFLLVALVGFAFEYFSRQQTSASGSTVPSHVTISNITDVSFTVSWQTESPATGIVVAQAQGISTPSTWYDERDRLGSPSKYETHMVTVRSAAPATLYEITIISNGKKYTGGAQTYAAQTASPLPPSASTLDPAYGQITAPTEQSIEGALVYLTLEDGQLLSTMTNANGTWLIPLNLARTADLTGYIPPQERIGEEIVARYGTKETRAVTDTLNDNPVPTMMLGQMYDFRKIQAEQTKGQPIATARQPQTVLGDTSSRANDAVTIIRPAQGAALATNVPLIAGTGIAGNSVSIVLGITSPIGGSTTVGSDGIWRFTPTQPLTAGRQSVTVTTNGSTGKPVAITHIFEILKSGTQVLGDATPSADLTPTITPTIGVVPTATPSSTPIPVPTAPDLIGDDVPTSGSPLPLLLMLAIGILFISTGAFVYTK